MPYEEYVEKVRAGSIELIDEGWTRGTWARDENHISVEWDSSMACKWCLGGAVLLAAKLVWDSKDHPMRDDYFRRFIDDWARSNPDIPEGVNRNAKTLSYFNDHMSTKKEDVIRSLRNIVST